MHPAQSQLFADHHNFLRLLHCLGEEVTYYEANQPWRANLPVILDIFDYVQFYPEQYHHPLEDELFNLLLRKGIGDAQQLWAMKSDHKELEALTHRASSLFDMVARDNVVPVDQLVTVTRAFLVRQLDHINRENRLIYPLLSANISDAEWDQLVASIAQRKDPLFGKGIIAEYRDLYNAITKAERGIMTGATARARDRPTPAL
jgi:hemerythrin-like domain-containing protein